MEMPLRVTKYRKFAFAIISVIGVILLIGGNFNVSPDTNNLDKTSTNNIQYGARLTNYHKTLCQLDHTRLKALEHIDFENEPARHLEQLFHEFVTNPFNSACQELKRFGGRYINGCGQYPDGHKYVCMDDILRDIETGNCLVYSFGIADDWSFEDVMDNLGCTVYAFDPSVDYPKHRGNQITFEKIGVSAATDEKNKLFSMSEIFKKTGHTNTKISYLKFDIEGHELAGLPAWYHSGALANVQQLGFEFHLNGERDAAGLFKTIRDLTLNENYRLIVHDLNGVWANCRNYKQKTPYYNFAEVVLKRLDSDQSCD